jgi:hypothetical protein
VVRFALDQPAEEDIAIGYRVWGVAAVGVDFEEPGRRVTIPAGKRSADLEIKPRDDARREANETCIVTLTPSAAYTGDGSAGQAAIVIRDDDNVLVDESLKLYYTFDGTVFTMVRRRSPEIEKLQTC